MKIRTVIKTVVTMAMLACMAIPVFAVECEGTITESHTAKQVLQSGEVNDWEVEQGDRVEILNQTDTYYEVALKSGFIVQVEKEHVLMDAPKVEAPKVETNEADELVSYAKQFIGTPYRPGGNDLSTGVDCSGFTKGVFGKFDITLQRSSRDQYASNGRSVSKGELQPGDLVFYGYSGRVSHVAIYIGNSQVIHASTGDRGVVIDPLDLRGMPPFIGYKRVL